MSSSQTVDDSKSGVSEPPASTPGQNPDSMTSNQAYASVPWHLVLAISRTGRVLCIISEFSTASRRSPLFVPQLRRMDTVPRRGLDHTLVFLDSRHREHDTRDHPGDIRRSQSEMTFANIHDHLHNRRPKVCFSFNDSVRPARCVANCFQGTQGSINWRASCCFSHSTWDYWRIGFATKRWSENDARISYRSYVACCLHAWPGVFCTAVSLAA